MDPAKAAQYMSIAEHLAETLSKDPSRKVGALFLAPESLQILSTGYNGMPRGVAELESRWQRPEKYLWLEHAERNAIYNAVRRGTPLEGAFAVVTLFPCCDCARGLIQAGVVALITRAPNLSDPKWGNEFVTAQTMMSEAGIRVQYVPAINA